MTIVRHLLKSMFHVPSLNLTTWKFDIDASSASFDGLEAIVGSWKRTPCLDPHQNQPFAVTGNTAELRLLTSSSRTHLVQSVIATKKTV